MRNFYRLAKQKNPSPNQLPEKYLTTQTVMKERLKGLPILSKLEACLTKIEEIPINPNFDLTARS